MTKQLNPPKHAEATLETMRRVFTLPENELSTLSRLDREISENLLGFLTDRVVAGDIAPANLERDFQDTALPEHPLFVSEQVDFILNKVVAQSVRTASPSFVGHMTSSLPYFMFPLAKIMMTLNQNVVKIETSKAFTPLERQVIGILHRLVYDFGDEFYDKWTQSFQQSLGVFCSGGTIANVTGLWAARNTMLGPRGDFAGIQKAGLVSALRHYELDDIAVLISRRGHYSMRKTADLLGLGHDQLHVVDINAKHQIEIGALRKKIAALRQQRIGVMAIVGIAGATETGSVDPLDEMADVAAEAGAHFHVDAAWGGPTLFSSRYKHLLKGIERADSVTIDAHKQLYVPVGAGMVLFKNPQSLSAVEHHANYIIRQGSRDIGKHTLEGTRPGMAMLVHSALHIIGKKGYELLIDLGIGKAGQFAKMIRATSDFEVITEPQTNILTYRYVPAAARRILDSGTAAAKAQVNEILSELTESIQKDQRTAGKTFVSRTRLESAAYGGQLLTVLRVVLANPLTTRQILSDILEEQRGYGEKLMHADHEDGFLAKIAGITD
ncbi:MAG: putative pyridoxal-dependent aspartate 1-decarboxylase [Deltaproteobacteria bacterium]|nr:putative pyridoxal-dependent aspartate 1-decarboxylase [Deltaproteobacteria bacterium]